MGTSTTRIALYKPTVGETGYGPAVGDSMDVLDLLVGTLVLNACQAPYNAVGDGLTDNGTAFGNALNALALAGGGTLYIPNGTYAYATSPNWARQDVNIVCDRNTVLLHTGTGMAFNADGGTATGLYGLRYLGVNVQGNANSTHGIYLRNLHHSTFALNCKGAATTGAGIYLEGCLANTFDTPRCSTNEGTVSPLPLHGMYFTRKTTGGNVDSNANTILTPVFEGLTNTGGAGLYFDYANSNKIVGGTSEGNKRGVQLTLNAARNAFAGIDLESNTDYDVYCEGSYNNYYGLNCTGIMRFTGGSASWNGVFGGLINQLTLDTNATLNTIIGITTGSTGGTLSDTGTNTYKANNYDGVNARLHAESAKRTQIVATASLPAGSTAMNGTELIEDAGAGVFNHIIYAGGARQRRNGYTVF